jgi:polar amino acid transport system substrate-binding protein
MSVEHFPPFTIAKAGEWSGLEIELSQALFQEANCNVKYVTIPWKRSLYLLEHGSLDVLPSMSMTKKRQAFTHFIGPMRTENVSLVVSAQDNTELKKLDDIKKFKKRIGLGYAEYYGEAFTHKIENDPSFAAKFEYTDFSTKNIKKLQRGRISGYLGDQYFVAYQLKQEGIRDLFKMHDYFINQDYVYLGFSKKSVSAENINNLEDAFRRLKDTGVFEQILAQYY